jgi:uroporphyrin-III C-methyltransferase / precorrin-2 dehydrogenase / sirohydrochlorin ferrochelatase
MRGIFWKVTPIKHMAFMGTCFPIFLDLRSTDVLVVGAGKVAARKIAALVGHGAAVTVVSRRFSAPVERLVEEGVVRGIRGPFRAGHLEGMHLAFAATDDPGTNREVSRAAARRNIPVNVADAPRDCSFILPAVVSGKEFTLAVSTGGKHPGAARAVREFLDEHREEISVRMERGRRRREIRAAPGKVHIVGAGPGDPDLLTVRALGLLRSADAVIHDYLVPDAILSLASPNARKLCFARRGRTAGHGSRLKQDAIHEAMARLAREGKSVVRLKSGDPLVFGRGGEEAEYLAAEGIPFEIVPGITAAAGCAAAAMIPLTRRGLSSSITLLAGHEADETKDSSVEWDRLPRRGTLAVYMGIGRSRALARDLVVLGGFPPDLPVAVVENGTRPDQRVLRGTLGELPTLLEACGVRSPALLFIGESAGTEIAVPDGRRDVEEREDGSVAQGV